MKYYIATVQIAVFAENEPEACDAISACLSENLMQAGAIVDWQYTRNTTSPILAGELNINDYEEGEAFIKINAYPESNIK